MSFQLYYIVLPSNSSVASYATLGCGNVFAVEGGTWRFSTMPRLKKTSSMVLDNAAARAAGLESINAVLDLGNTLTVVSYKTAITAAQTALNGYNTLLSQTDEASNAFQMAEAKVRDLSDRMLAGVAARYGRESDEYEMAGGTRRSERKRRTTSKANAKLGIS